MTTTMTTVKLLTMAPKEMTRKNLNEKERELKNVKKLLRRLLKWCMLTGESYEPSEEYSIYPQLYVC